MVTNRKTRFSFIAFYLLSTCVLRASSSDSAYAKSLLKFKKSLTNATMLQDWNDPTVEKLCSNNTPIWTGCLCLNGSFVGLRLEKMGLGGKIDINSLSDLPLFSLSVMNNNFSGPFPSDINKLEKLRSLYLGSNRFNGEISDDVFIGMKFMKKIVLSDNFFDGKIPLSLLKLPKLVSLEIENNRFKGRIPDFWQSNLTVNLSNNKLEGHIPATLRNQNASSFFGNTKLCGMPLKPCKPNKMISKITLTLTILLGFSLTAFTILLLISRRRIKPLKYSKSIDSFYINEPTYTKPKKPHKKNEHEKLYFLRKGIERFEFEELLRASAEVLGSGSFGSSYKAVLFSGQAYVVRRFKQMSNVGKEEFYEQMRRLGRLSHPNLLSLVAFYYRKEEKLLITDFVENGSLASHLHGKRSCNNQTGLDWATRLRIIKGVARGLAYLYKELPSITLPHGHLKSSNVLLNTSYEPILSDYALAQLIDKDHAHKFMVAYKSPESTQNGRVTRKTDIWSLGILILELLTGRFPSADLATWVNSVVSKEWTSEVFDKDMNLSKKSERQMLRLLKIGMCCCEWNVDKRWDLREAFEKIEELKEKDCDDDYSSFSKT